MWKVEVIGHDTIKPTSPTPPQLNTHKLSWLDRMCPPISVNLVLFYPNATAAVEKLLPVLEKSLSETLTIFYPFAGRLDPRNTSVVDCNDEGVDLFVAQVVTDDHASLSQLLDRSIKHGDLVDLLPPKGSKTMPLLSLQVTVFPACNGMAIGACVLHKLADAHSIAEFLATWAATARGDRVISFPAFDAASRLGAPSHDFPNSDTLRPAWGKPVTRSFVFEQSAIDAITISSKEDRPKPTRVVAVSALVWRCLMRVQLRTNKLASVAFFPANMRGKGGDLPDRLFGNLCVYVAASDVIDGASAEVGEEKIRTEDKLSSATKSVGSEWIARIVGPDGMSAGMEKWGEAEKEVGDYGEEVRHYSFSSWLRFPLYETDFGWGKPTWVAQAGLYVKDAVVLMGRGEKGGIEVWVTLEEVDMDEFEKDEELMSYGCTTHA